MDSPAAEEGAAAPRRLNPKLLIVGGASALLLAIVAGVTVWLWPKGPDPAEAKAARLAARRAAAQASAPAALPASAAASAADDGEAVAVHEPTHEPTHAQAQEAAHAEARAPAHDASPAATPAEASPVVASAIPTVAPIDRPAVPAQRPIDEASIDRLQRRLSEVLGAKVTPGQAGELRVLARSAQVVPVGHTATTDATRSAAAPARAEPPAAASPGHGTHWSYDGVGGPQAWGRLKPEFSLCAAGRRQSPIDIRDGISLDLEPLRFDYRPGGFSVIDNGHTVQVNVAPGNAIEVNGKRYALQQFHFHRPSEERIDGRQFEMDVHLVHRDAEGRLAVVAVLLERGAAQPLLQTVWNNLPLEKHEETAARVPLDPGQLLPADPRYYTYMGSLTTPPCSEGVLWLVMQQPVTVSAQQIDIFARLYPKNARPLQQAAGRTIKQSN
ncbi:MAG: carbonic anhydrase family protein [Rubrivivax sp.]|nr:carbonic anhydrase family protein [Rubrivivax sp.]